MFDGMMKTPLGRFRLVGILEGISFLFLLGIAMPVKYMLDFPALVKYTGWAHGVLFVAYVLLLLQVATEYSWSFKKSLIGFVVSLLPFGTFWFEKKLKEEAAVPA